MIESEAKGQHVATATSDAEQFATKIEAASRLLFRGTPRDARLREMTRRLREDCFRLRERGSQAAPLIAVVGGLAEGKSWLARCFLEDHDDNTTARQDIKSGQDNKDRTTQLTWFGPEPPLGLDNSREQFVRIPKEHMLDLGRAYVVGDTPGFCDHDAARRGLSGVAATSAPIKIVVASTGQLRDGRYNEFIESIDGALVLPVVKFEPASANDLKPSDETLQDVGMEVARWRQAAPTAEILGPCFMPVERIAGTKESEARMRHVLKEALPPLMDRAGHLRQSIERQIQGRIDQTHREVAANLTGFRNRVGGSVRRLKDVTERFPQRVLGELLGDDMVLRVGIRQRFRADWIDRTPLICFPYRSLLGLLVLTAGAWDRLIFSIAGSVPSLALVAFQAVKNLRNAPEVLERLRGGLRDRTERLLEEELRADIRNFHTAVASAIEGDENATTNTEADYGFVRLPGLESVEAESSRIFRLSVDRNRARTGTVWLFAFTGMGAFTYLIAGPVVSLYRTYLEAHWHAFSEVTVEFPAPAPSMLLASLLLSVAPVFIAALVAMSWSCNSRRVRRTVNQVTAEHDSTVRQHLENGSLKIELADPRLNAARFLLGLSSEEVRGPMPKEKPSS